MGKFYRTKKTHMMRIRVLLLSLLMIGMICVLASCAWMFAYTPRDRMTLNNGDTIVDHVSYTQDFTIYLHTVDGMQYKLIPVAESDSNEVLEVCELSEDQSTLVCLIQNSNRYEHGTKLWVFDVTDKPLGADHLDPEVEIENREVVDASIDNAESKVECQYVDCTWEAVYPFGQ